MSLSVRFFLHHGRRLYDRLHNTLFINLITFLIMCIKEVLSERGITYKVLAARLGVSESAVKQMVNSRSVTLRTLQRVAVAVGVPVWRLIVSNVEIKDQFHSHILCPNCGHDIVLRVSDS